MGMVRRASSVTVDHLYCPVNLSRDNTMELMADTSVKLWKNGHNVQFRPFHRAQAESYRCLILPPHQFETRHLLDFNLDAMLEPKSIAPVPVTPPVLEPTVVEPDLLFITFLGFQDAERKLGVFTIDPRAPEWSTIFAGHAVLA
jgi:hypothetical protein